MKKYILIAFVISTILSCNNDDDSDCCPQPTITNLSFSFTHNWDGQDVSANDIDNTSFTNENGEVISISRFRYLLSHFVLVNSEGNRTTMPEYQLVDLSDAETLSLSIENLSLEPGYYNLEFVYGFNEEDNTDGAYTDLNAASWNWPEMLGGGYHFMQFDGLYNVDTDIPMPFNYHNGTAKISEDEFQQNFINFVSSTTIALVNSTNIEIKLNISELFKNPNTWDLNQYNTELMPNYDAQILMHQNIANAFIIGQTSIE